MANFADLWEAAPVDRFGGLNEDISSRLRAANDAWQAKTGRELPLTSGARSTEEQIQLFGKRKSNPNLVAKPGTSLHEKGMAADISPEVPAAFLDQFGLHRPFGSKDPVHVEINPKSSYSPKSASVTVSGAPASTSFADLWESTPAEPIKTEEPKTISEVGKKFGKEVMKPLSEMSVQDWKDKSLIAPAIEYTASSLGIPGFTEEDKKAAQEKLIKKGKSFVEGVNQFLESPVQTTKQALSALADNPGKFVGESVKSVIYDPEQIPLGTAAGKAVSEVAGKAVGQVKDIAKTVAEAPAYQGLVAKNKGVAETMQEGFQAYKQAQTLETPKIPVSERSITVPEEMPINRAETAPLNTNELSSREELLRRIGLEDIRNSALVGNPKESASQFITSQADQGPYATGMTNQINLEKSVLDNHFKKIQDEAGGTVIRHGTSFQEGDKIRVGKTIKDALQEGYEGHQTGTTTLYKEATDKLGNKPVELGKFNEFLKMDENFAYQNEKGLQTAINQFVKRKQFVDEAGNLKPLTVAQAEEIRKFINKKYHHETKQLGGELKGLIDKDVFETVGGETYEKARKHYQKGIEVYDNPKAVGDLLGDNGVNQKIPDEKVAAKVVTLPNSQFEHLFNTLDADGKIGAVNQIKTSLVEQIREAGNSTKNQPFNSVAAAKEASNLSEKLKIAFKNDPKGLEAIYDGIEAADILYIPNKYPGAGVQTNLLQNKFVDVGIRRAFGSAGAAVGGTVAGPFGAAGGAVAGEAIGGKVSGKVSASKQEKALKKEIKTKLQDIGKE
jgi:LAS superfamily LD-carboxypeptidase LdcB